MGDADDIEVLLKAAEITQQMHRDVKRMSWAKALLVGLVTGAVMLVGAGWKARCYIEEVKVDIRKEIRMAIEPVAQEQTLVRRELWETQRALLVVPMKTP